MSWIGEQIVGNLKALGPEFLPFMDAATPELPLRKLLRLSMFQVTVGMAVVLLIGTLNRVMIVELGVPAWLVAVMISLPLLVAPLRAVIGFLSDTYQSAIGWRRVPFIWLGTMLQFGGLAIMPFALLILSGDTQGPIIIGQVAAALAFLLVGAGLHTVQTCGLALATDLAPTESHPRVVALLCMMLMVGMVVSAVLFGFLLRNFSEFRLIQVIQGAGAVTMIVNSIALWQQEARDPNRVVSNVARPKFIDSWRMFTSEAQATRRLVAVGLGTFAFSMQDVLLEPYGGQVLHLSVGSTTTLTALLAVGGIIAFVLSAWLLDRGAPPYRLAAFGVLAGLLAFPSVIAAAPFESRALFSLGTVLIGFGAALFVVGTLTAAMETVTGGLTGLALGAWGAVQASAAGAAIALGGITRDVVAGLASQGLFGPTLDRPSTGYNAVYLLEIVMLLATLVAIGPLVRRKDENQPRSSSTFGLAENP